VRESWDSDWRQGSFLRQDAVPQLAVAISHSCDIAQPKEREPNVEFIAASVLDKSDGNFTQAKNPRTLDLEVAIQGKNRCLRLVATDKLLLSKELLDLHQPDRDYVLSESAIRILREWLSSRYDRQAFPDALNARLRPLLKLLEKEGAKRAQSVLGFWMDYEPRDKELQPDERYDVSLFLVYSAEDCNFALEAEELAAKLKECLQRLNGLTVLACQARSEGGFTVEDTRKNVQYRLDYVSFRNDPHGPTV
jgi:hypothetical protein